MMGLALLVSMALAGAAERFAACPPILTGEGGPELRIGMSAREYTSLLGAPDASVGGMRYYTSRGFSLAVFGDGGLAAFDAVAAEGGGSFGGSIAGLSLGSPRAAVVQLLGAPESHALPDGTELLVDRRRGLRFGVRDGVVTRLALEPGCGGAARDATIAEPDAGP